MNDLYEFGGSADVLIKTKTDTEIGGIKYQAGEPYTVLKDVLVYLDYNQNEKDITAKKSISSSQTARPSIINITRIELTTKMCNLIGTIKSEEQIMHMKNIKCYCDNENSLYLDDIPANNQIFVYNKSFERIEIDRVEDTTIYGDFEVDKEYLVFYNEFVQGRVYDFEVPHYPYFSIEIIAKGNTNKSFGTTLMKFDSVSLVSVPRFNFIQGDILNIPLTFKVIYQNQEEPVVVFN